MINKINNWWVRKRQYRKWLGIHKKFAGYTMMDRYLFADNLMLAQGANNIDGDVVECGVWRGGMSAGIATVMNGHRHYFLLDSFEGMPSPTENDGLLAREWWNGKMPHIYYNNCAAETNYAEVAMGLTGKPFSLVKGWFQNTLSSFTPSRPIAVLRLDADWYDSILICLQHLYPQVAANGLVLLDDYYSWDGCSRAVHFYLASINSKARIFRTANGVAYIIKPSEDI